MMERRGNIWSGQRECGGGRLGGGINEIFILREIGACRLRGM
jgi:hypothetical protein